MNKSLKYYNAVILQCKVVSVLNPFPPSFLRPHLFFSHNSSLMQYVHSKVWNRKSLKEMPFPVKIYRYYPTEANPPLYNTPKRGFILRGYASHAMLKSGSVILFFFTHTVTHWEKMIHTAALFSSHTLTNRGQSTGQPWADSGSRRGTWVRQEGRSVLTQSLLLHPSSLSSSRRRPYCPWQNPRSLFARKAKQRRERTDGPRRATGKGSNEAPSLTLTPEKTQRRRR